MKEHQEGGLCTWSLCDFTTMKASGVPEPLLLDTRATALVVVLFSLSRTSVGRARRISTITLKSPYGTVLLVSRTGSGYGG